MNQPVRRLAAANSHPPDFQPGRFNPFRVGDAGERRANQRRAKGGEKPAAARFVQFLSQSTIRARQELRAAIFDASFDAMRANSVQSKPSPLWLLVRVNALHGWRRLLAVREQSRLLTSVIGLFIAGYLVVSFDLFFHGMRFIAKFPGLGAVLTERLLFTLFAFLFALLLLSNLVISYTNLFRNRETLFLLSLPVPAQTIFRWKFIESTVLASWAFLFLIAPLLAAFGLVRGVPWHFYLMTPVLIAMFIVLPGVLGAALAICGAVFGPAQFSDRPGGDRAGAAGAGGVLVEGAAGGRRIAQQADARGARSVAGQDPFHDVSVSAQLLAFVRRAAMDRRRPARRGLFRAGAVEPHAFFRQHRVHALRRAVLRHRVGGAKPRGNGFKLGWFRARPQKAGNPPACWKLFSRNFSGWIATRARWR